MEPTEDSGEVLNQTPLLDLSFNSIIKYSFDYQNDSNFENFKESENIPSFLNFLNQIWSYLTDSSLYPTLNGKTKGTVVPFMYDDRTRELVSNNILKFLDTHREELSPTSRDSDHPSSVVSNIAQGHLLTCFKLLSSFVMYNDGDPDESLVYALINLVRVFMKLVPFAIDLSTLLDFLTDLVKTLPPEDCSAFSEFVVSEAEYFSEILNDLKLRQNHRMVQTCSAKLIGLVRVFETNFEQSSLNFDYSSNVFNLRFLLTQCLPVSHLGICNRQSVSAEPKTVTKMSLEEWNKVEKTTLRSKCEGLSDYEISTYESFVSPGTSKLSPNQIYDIKSYLSKSDKVEKSFVKSVKMPSYEVYSNFCDLYVFLQNPEIIVLKTQDYVEELQKQYSSVLSYVNSLAESTSGNVSNSDPPVSWMEFDGGVCDFVNKSSNLKFWSNFLMFSCLSFQTLKLFHKKPSDLTTYELLKEKCVTVLENIEKNVWNTISKIRNLSDVVQSMLQKEEQWIKWKLNGCNDDLTPVNDNKLELVTFDQDLENFNKEDGEFRYEEKEDLQDKPEENTDNTTKELYEDLDDEDEEYEKDDGSVLSTLRELEKITYEFGDKESRMGSNFRPVVADLELNKESVYWYLPDINPYQGKLSLEEQLRCKFDDYCKKMEMDEDPENDISEPERSKHDPLFKMRFVRLFAMNHLEKFMEMSTEDIASGSIEPMLRLVRGVGDKEKKDGKEDEKNGDESVQESPTKKQKK